jgi:hypothetical protein
MTADTMPPITMAAIILIVRSRCLYVTATPMWSTFETCNALWRVPPMGYVFSECGICPNLGFSNQLLVWTADTSSLLLSITTTINGHWDMMELIMITPSERGL